MNVFARILACTVLLVGLVFFGCKDPVFTEPQVLGGVEVPAKVLEDGRHVYRRYCISCHGAAGDGRGHGSYGQIPPPRDLRSARFKFAGVQENGLPSDEALAHVIRRGLKGTYMRPWNLRDSEMHSVIQYIKTFSPEGKGFRDPERKTTPLAIPEDPFVKDDEIKDAVERGEELYHVHFMCSSCHPYYVDAPTIDRWQSFMRPDRPFDPVPKWSENFRGTLVPPDFLSDQMRAIDNREDLFRTIAYGLQGPMPGYSHLGAHDVWAVVHYVDKLRKMAGTKEGRALRAKLLESKPAAEQPRD